ncbi:hypothetical protein [Novosphingobium gossypii]|uniref:hypothetical protein n=1 Tax=Novosphingobium gossypii TaxID=1604774 RepID=UPI003D218430
MVEQVDPFPEILTADQVRFEIVRGVQRIARSVQRDMLVEDQGKAQRAQAQAVAVIVARFDKLQVRGPAPIQSIFQDRPR